ncbi:MAG: germination protein YpeB [Hominimerdicola sp.]
MHISKRTLIRVISFITAAVLVLIVRNLILMKENTASRRTVVYNYSRAMDDLAEACDNISSTLEKEMYAGSGEMHRNLAVKLYREAAAAKAALAQLPMEEMRLENTYKFLSQVGNYSLALSEKLMNNEVLTAEEYDNIEELYEFASDLKDDLWELEDLLERGEIDLVAKQTSNKSQEPPPTITDGFTDFEDGFDEYPTLIYDGPFSDNIMEKTPKMTSNAKEVTQDKALERASMALNINPSDLPQVSTVDGKMPGWRFSDENNSLACEITKNGGYLSYFLKSRIVNTTSISTESAVEYAEKFLDDLGILSMKTTYYEVKDNTMTINFAYDNLGVCVYPDLVKVSVAMDNGEILGYDARGYLVNHTQRTTPENLYSESKAEEKVSDKLTIKSHQLAVIPTENLEEKLCYEFKCQSKNGRNVLVYINAEDGSEEQILILVESENGTLTI